MPQPITAENLAALPGIAHGFFGRLGGVSEGNYASLNCGLGSADDRAAVGENRRRVAGVLGNREMPVVTLYQVHSATAVVVDRPFAADSVPKADALVTRTPGLIIGAMAADCTPVLFADPEARIVGAAHAGWRGALGGVLEATLAAMESLGAETGRIQVAIGPTINQPAYEVGPEFETELTTSDPASTPYFTRFKPGGKAHFDLPGYVAERLRRAGIGHIERQTLCTYANPDRLFSYRRTVHARQPDYGRQISAIVVT